MTSMLPSASTSSAPKGVFPAARDCFETSMARLR